MKITILGANSFIARNMIYELHQRQQKGLDLQLFLYDYMDTQVDGEENYRQINVLDVESVNQINYDVDLIYMFIGKTGTMQGFDDYDTFININEKALLNILKGYVQKESNAKLVFPSTRLVYKGKEGFLKEDAEKEFKTVYAINKYACEQYLNMFHMMYGVKYVTFRICVPYGTMIPNASSYGTAEFMLNKAKSGEDISLYGDGSVRRTLTHMEDLCDMLLEGGFSSECVNDIYNIGGENYSLKEMAEKIAKEYFVGVTYVEWPENALKIESGDTVFNSEKLDSIINYHCKHKFEDWL